MSDEWLDVAYINYEEAIMHGHIVDAQRVQSDVRQVLTEEQKRDIEDLNSNHASSPQSKQPCRMRGRRQ